MEDNQIPDAWVGQPVRVLLLRPGGYRSNFQPLPMRGSEYEAVLEAVNDRGMVATVDFGVDEQPEPGVFYPWGAVLSMQLAEGR